MFKLTVVNGHARGTSYNLKSGQVSIGRVQGNDIVLESKKVSKKHCVLVVNNTDVTVQDAGSSNGTFINGMLAQAKKINPGDRISVGEYVLELSKSEQKKVNTISNIIPFPQNNNGAVNISQAAIQQPQGLKEKLQQFFEKNILLSIYNLNEKQEWRVILIGLIATLTIGSALLSVFPVLDRVNTKLEEEARERAFILGRQMVEGNSKYIFNRQPTQIDISFVEKEKGVQGAYIIDMDGRVLAPARLLNQNLTESYEASFSAIARRDFSKKEKLESKWKNYQSVVATAVPLRVFSQSDGKNVTAALALVFFDKNQVAFDIGTILLSYIQALILCSILGVLIYVMLYKLTLRPLTLLNEGIDSVLKGSAVVIEKKFQMEEIDSLVDMINVTLQRLHSSQTGTSSHGLSDSSLSDEMISTIKFCIDKMPTVGAIFLSQDKKILHLNAYMEEITGIRLDRAIQNDISAVARDQAFSALVEDMTSKAGLELVQEDFDFSGTSYHMECCAIGVSHTLGSPPQAYLVTAVKGDS